MWLSALVITELLIAVMTMMRVSDDCRVQPVIVFALPVAVEGKGFGSRHVCQGGDEERREGGRGLREALRQVANGALGTPGGSRGQGASVRFGQGVIRHETYRTRAELLDRPGRRSFFHALVCLLVPSPPLPVDLER